MSRIKAVTNDNRLIITSRPEITSGSRNVNELSVVFDKSWELEDAEYFVNFYIDDDTDGVIRKFTVSGSVGSCTVPDYATEKEGFFHFGVFARADGDIVKTSDVAAYEVKKGICTRPTGGEHDSASEIRRRFIDLMNANMNPEGLDYSMPFEDIDATFTGYMNQLYSRTGNFSDMSGGLFNLVKEYVDPDIIEIDDPAMQYIASFVALEDYFRNAGFQTDSADEELQVFKGDMLGLIRTYADESFDESSDIALYSGTLEDYLEFASLAVENSNRLYEGITELNTQEDDNE